MSQADNSFTAAVRKSITMLRAYALRWTRDQDEAEDAVQSALESAWKAWPSYDPARSEASTWLCLIVKSRLIDRHRRALKQPRDLGFDLSDAHDSGTMDSAEDWASYLDTQRAVARLDADHRTVLELAASGETYSEIARRLKIPMGTVMSRLHRARKRLQVATDAAEGGEAQRPA